MPAAMASSTPATSPAPKSGWVMIPSYLPEADGVLELLGLGRPGRGWRRRRSAWRCRRRRPPGPRRASGRHSCWRRRTTGRRSRAVSAATLGAALAASLGRPRTPRRGGGDWRGRGRSASAARGRHEGHHPDQSRSGVAGRPAWHRVRASVLLRVERSPRRPGECAEGVNTCQAMLQLGRRARHRRPGDVGPRSARGLGAPAAQDEPDRVDRLARRRWTADAAPPSRR